MADIDYALEKIGAALDGMAYSTKRIQDRLYDACQSMKIVEADAFPGELQHEWDLFIADVTAVTDDHLGSFRASTNGMTDDDASESARKLVNFRHRLEFYLADNPQAGR